MTGAMTPHVYYNERDPYLCDWLRNLITQGSDDGVAARGLEASDMDLNGSAAVEIKAIGSFALGHLGQHRDVGQQCAHVAENDAGLLAVGGYDEDCSSLTGCEEFSVLIEAGQEDCA